MGSQRASGRAAKLAAAAVAAALALAPATPSARTLLGQPRIVDGDTLVLDGVRLRLEGIDAPEREQDCREVRTGRRLPCGRLATEALADQISGREVACLLLVRDRYGRFVARCHTAGPGGRDLSAAMAGAGWAVPFMADGRPDIVAAAAAARLRGLGLWGMAFEMPADYRRRHHGGAASR